MARDPQRKRDDAWERRDIVVPDMTDRDTVVTLAKMTFDASRAPDFGDALGAVVGQALAHVVQQEIGEGPNGLQRQLRQRGGHTRRVALHVAARAARVAEQLTTGEQIKQFFYEDPEGEGWTIHITWKGEVDPTFPLPADGLWVKVKVAVLVEE